MNRPDGTDSCAGKTRVGRVAELEGRRSSDNAESSSDNHSETQCTTLRGSLIERILTVCIVQYNSSRVKAYVGHDHCMLKSMLDVTAA
jgi:hypothetical protein